MTTDVLDRDVRLTLTTNEMITIQAALNIAKKENGVTVAYADSAFQKIDAAIDRWAGA